MLGIEYDKVMGNDFFWVCRRRKWITGIVWGLNLLFALERLHYGGILTVTLWRRQWDGIWK
jgi:hypothetical protein